jgi:hypothetical protein
MGGGSPDVPTNTTQTTQVELPEFVQPYAEDYLQKVSTASQNPDIFQPYQGPRVAPLDAFHQAGITRTAAQAIGGFPGQAVTYDQYANTVGGQYLHPDTNPYLQDTYNRAARGVTDQYTYATQPGLTAQAVRNRAMGNSGQQQYEDMARWSLGENLSGLASDIYGGNYQTERDHMVNTMQMAPQMQAMGYRDNTALMGLGDIRRGVGQELINQSILQDYEARMAPLRALDVLGSGISAAAGGGSSVTSTSPTFFPASGAAGALGAGLLGLGVGNMFFGGQQ